MRFTFPKNDGRYLWTEHVKIKMVYYGLSADKIKRVIRNPLRVEDGVAENTTAVMSPSGTAKKPTEIWVMYATEKPLVESRKLKVESSKFKTQRSHSAFHFQNSKLIIISAWRYPGVSPIGKKIPIPEDILEELKNQGF